MDAAVVEYTRLQPGSRNVCHCISGLCKWIGLLLVIEKMRVDTGLKEHDFSGPTNRPSGPQILDSHLSSPQL